MNINQNPPINEEERTNVVPFERPKLATAGKGPPPNNWLAGLSVGNHFLARDKQTLTIDMTEYSVIRIEENAFLLTLHAAGKDIPVWVDPARFSSKHELVLILI